MPAKLTSKFTNSIQNYYDALSNFETLKATNEGAVRIAFQTLLNDWGREKKITVLGEQTIESAIKTSIRLDGILVDDLKLRRGYWEAKDSKDKLEDEIAKKIAKGYPLANTIFEDTRRAVLYQGGKRIDTFDLRDSARLRYLLDEFIGYRPPQIEHFHKAVAEFKERIPDLAKSLTELIDEAKKKDAKFRAALQNFLELCQSSLNPQTTPEQVEDMLKQHLLTERIFRSIFQNPDFVRRNPVAVELEKMVTALTSHSFSRDAFLSSLDYFYAAIEETARTIKDYSEKQSLLNTLYEQFFQAYSVKAADTFGIVYTPAEIVRFMVASVQEALKKEFGLELGSEDVHIIDPCVGTGTFVMELLRQIPTSRLENKYKNELHANEVQLLPYYIASQNIEHEYFERTGSYEPFPGLCFADTLDLADSQQMEMFVPENTERVKLQKQAPIRVVIGNPPYNAWQENENDNNKNRKHKTVDKRISETYAKASLASNKNALSDPYVKFFRWATDRLGSRNGIVCYVSNNSFVDQIAFDGMRSHLLKDFTRIYTYDLGGNVRKNPKLSGSKHNVFGIQVGVTITLLIRNSQYANHELYYARMDEFWTKYQKLEGLTKKDSYSKVDWETLHPDTRNTWLTEGLNAHFDTLIPIGTKESKVGSLVQAETIFKTYSPGVQTSRDDWVFDFKENNLAEKVQLFIETFNSEVDRWNRANRPRDIDSFVLYDDRRIKWSSTLKSKFTQAKHATFNPLRIRKAFYRPFTVQSFYYDDLLVHRPAGFHSIFPTNSSEKENTCLCLTGIASEKPFMLVMTGGIPDLHFVGPGASTQCFPFYTYAEDGSNRRENITDWALREFRRQYEDESITKWDIFYYVYGVLHSPEYRRKYVENLKRDLPRIPYVPQENFRAYVEAGEKLAKLHRDYELVKGHSLGRLENNAMSLDWRVEKMRLSPDKTNLRYNDWLTLTNIPPRVFEYKLGNRSALEWVIDQYQVSTDQRSGITHDPNNAEDPKYILRLIEQVVQVSLDTLAIIEAMPSLE